MLRRNFLSSIPFLSLLPFGFTEKENPENLPVLKFDNNTLVNRDELFTLAKKVSNFDEYMLGFDPTFPFTDDRIVSLKKDYAEYYYLCECYFIYCYLSQMFAGSNCLGGYSYTGNVVLHFRISGPFRYYNIYPCEFTRLPKNTGFDDLRVS